MPEYFSQLPSSQLQLQLGGPLFQLQVSWVMETTPPAAPPVLGSQQLSTAGPGRNQNSVLAPLNLPPLQIAPSAALFEACLSGRLLPGLSLTHTASSVV